MGGARPSVVVPSNRRAHSSGARVDPPMPRTAARRYPSRATPAARFRISPTRRAIASGRSSHPSHAATSAGGCPLSAHRLPSRSHSRSATRSAVHRSSRAAWHPERAAMRSRVPRLASRVAITRQRAREGFTPSSMSSSVTWRIEIPAPPPAIDWAARLGRSVRRSSPWSSTQRRLARHGVPVSDRSGPRDSRRGRWGPWSWLATGSAGHGRGRHQAREPTHEVSP